MELLLYGLIHSATLLLVAFGFSLVYGVSRLPNFAHGALYVLGGYVAWLLIVPLGLPYPLGVAAALLASAVLGAAIYQGVLRWIRGVEVAEVIATYALGVAVLEALQWGGLGGTTYQLPPAVEGSVEVLGVPVTAQRVVVVAVAALTVAAVWMLTRCTRLGLALRGVAQDEQAAMMVGIDADRMATLAAALGGALAGLAAVVVFPLGSIHLEEGYKVLIYALAVCVVGGLGSWTGTVVASLVLGFSQFLALQLERPQYQVVIMLGVIIATLVLRPSGLFGQQKDLEDRV